MEHIDFKAPDEVVEVHQSINKALVSLEGFTPQNCSGNVIVMKAKEGLAVYIAIHLQMDQRVLIYSSKEQPQDEAGIRKLRLSALQFLELSGFMVDPVSLPSDPRKRQKILSDIPVLRQGAGQSGHF